ncbi:hypothetical protein [Dechloromonas sp. HYN0024]|uniref:hypothetical protein n=1 Tax=Dechloromonas sp. HYN0024 TaxID=2231055 RepID=UPI000E44936A|nr:hypothetical protein [Dechloromonas sp. HYN0024]AXS79830.1 hypothetical protein HYN24_07260 [Dechloromonas sp. HYN0024]
MTSYSRLELHRLATKIFRLWAGDILDELDKSKSAPPEILLSVEEGRIWLLKWAEFAQANASVPNFTPGFIEYANLVNHIEWRKRHIRALSEKRPTLKTLNDEIALIYGWMFSNLGGQHA